MMQSLILKGIFGAGNHSEDVLFEDRRKSSQITNDDNFLLFYLLLELCLNPSVLMHLEKIKMLFKNAARNEEKGVREQEAKKRMGKH